MVISCIDCNVEIQVGSSSPTKCTSLGYFDVTLSVASNQENNTQQKMQGTSRPTMLPQSNVDVFERASGINQGTTSAINARNSDRSKYIRLCCCCFQQRSLSGNCRIDFCPSCDRSHKSTTAYSRAASSDSGIHTSGTTSTSESFFIGSGSRPSTISNEPAHDNEHCATLGFFKAHKKNIFRSKSVQYVHLCCNCYNDRPGMQIDPCSDCRERRLSWSYPKKYIMSGTVCHDCGLAIKQD
jgi:hypothetical protein